MSHDSPIRRPLGRPAGALLALLAVSPAVTLGAAEARAGRVDQQRSRPTRESLAARQETIAKARDALRALAAQAAPKDLKPGEKKAYDELIAAAREVADGCDALAARLAEGLKAEKPDLDRLSEMAEMESLRLQMMMDRRSKLLSTVSNVLKKMSDTASTIVQNLK